MVEKISMNVDDTLELDYLVEQINDNTIDVTEPNDASFSLDYGRKQFGIFDPSDPGTYTLDIDGQTVEIEVTDIPDSGVARWEFEDDSNTSTAIDSWSDQNITQHDLSLSGPSYVSGKVGSFALSFDELDDTAATGSNDDIWTPSGDFTVVGWIKPANSGSSAITGLFNVADSSSDWAIDTNGTTKTIRFFDGSTTGNVFDDSWTSGTWQQFYFGRSGSTMVLGRNGSDVDTTAFNSNHIVGHTNAYDFEMGYSPKSDSYYGGDVDDFRWYTASPSDVDVNSLYNNQK